MRTAEYPTRNRGTSQDRGHHRSSLDFAVWSSLFANPRFIPSDVPISVNGLWTTVTYGRGRSERLW